MKDMPKKLLKLSAAAALTTAIAAVPPYLQTQYLVKVALDRKVPRGLKKAGERISGSCADGAFLSSLKEAAQRLAVQEHETVELVSHDGTILAGHWFPQENAERVIIAMHGWRSSWSSDFGMIAEFWESNACSVLYAEQRGQNNSGGDCMGFGLTERYDCLDWIRWVIDRCGNEIPIYLGGVSMGATTVLMAAGLDLPENVHGIVGDCGFTSPHAIWKHIANNNLHIGFGVRGAMADALCKKRIPGEAMDYSTAEALRTCTVPVMLFHGAEDHFVPVEMTYENYKACAAPKRLFIVPGADHGMSYYVDKEGYESAVKDFWQRYDGSRGRPMQS